MKEPCNTPNSKESPTAFIRWLAIGVLLINLFVGALGCLSLLQSRHEHEERAAVTTQNLTRVLEQYISGTIDKIDMLLLATTDQIEKQIALGGIDRIKLDALMARQYRRQPELDGLRMTDANGEIVYGTGLTAGLHANIADRGYFKHLRDDPKAGLVISEPLISRVIGKWSFVVGRRVNRPNGSFAGVIYGVITLRHFLELFTSIDVGRQGAITLRDGELKAIARYPEIRDADGTQRSVAVSGMLRGMVRAGRKTGTYKTIAPVDHIERTYSFRKISDYPLYITVGLATGDYLAEWRREAAKMSAAAVFFFLMTLFASWRIWHDWKRRRATVEALIEQEKKYRTLFQESKDVVFIVDAEGNVIEMNHAGTELLGYTSEELLDMNLVSDFGITGKQMKALVKKQSNSGFVKDYELELRKKDGRMVVVLLSATEMRDESGRITGYRGIAHDITQRKMLELQLMQAQKMESIGLLAGGIAHDFNNLLTAISGYGELIRENIPPGDEDLSEGIEQILTASARAADLARGLLAFSRRQIMQPKPVHMDTIIRNTGKLIQRMIGEDIELRTSSNDAALMVMADVGQIEQVLMNLATNARDAMPHGGCLRISAGEEIVAEGSEARYDVEKPGRYVCISVADTGRGMDESHLDRIFEPFFTTKEVGKGTGLGLAMVHGIIKQHNGSIFAESRPGLGTTFNIYLPVIENGHPAAEGGETTETASGGRETILIAEDDEIVRTFMQKIFERNGYKVITSVDGEDAMRKFMDNREEISLILSDIIMPRKNGMQIFREARQAKPGIKVIFISGYTANLIQEKGILEEGMDFVTKPFLKFKLLQKVREVLDEN
jgi:PAS domain S-box-containing protein